MSKGTGDQLAGEGEHNGENHCVGERNSDAGTTGRKGNENTWGQDEEEHGDIHRHIHLL